jgi:acyl-CoA synthetase (AMP-forming)/AMP-acid ligase II
MHLTGARTLVELLQCRAALTPDRTLYTFLGAGFDKASVLTYRKLDRRARSLARQLQQRLRAGDRAILAVRPGPNYVTSFFGCLYAGVIAVPSYPPRPRRSSNYMHSIAGNCGAAAVLTDSPLRLPVGGSCGESSDHLPWMILEHEERSGSDEQVPSLLNPEEIAFLQYTSDSTGDLKGVIISHRNVMLNLKAAGSRFALDAFSRGVLWLPPYHDMGLISGLLAPIYAAAETVIMSPTHFAQRPIRWLEAITSTCATHSGGPNFAFELCVSQTPEEERASLDRSSWDVAFLGAEPIRVQTLRNFAEAFEPFGFRRTAFTPCYGMAEGTLLLTVPRKGLRRQSGNDPASHPMSTKSWIPIKLSDAARCLTSTRSWLSIRKLERYCRTSRRARFLFPGRAWRKAIGIVPSERRHTFYAELRPSGEALSAYWRLRLFGTRRARADQRSEDHRWPKLSST